MSLIFEDDSLSNSPFVYMIWRAQSAGEGAFISTANVYWEMVIMRYMGQTRFTIRGPETQATTANFPAGAEWLGITFRLGTFMPCLPPSRVANRQDCNLPLVGPRKIWLDGSAWEIPTFDTVDVFVERLIRANLIARDPIVDSALQGRPVACSPRALQYRFARATGLTRKTIQQIERANQAAVLLQSGRAILDVVAELGYYDQAHLTNALKRFLGRTPMQIGRAYHP